MAEPSDSHPDPSTPDLSRGRPGSLHRFAEAHPRMQVDITSESQADPSPVSIKSDSSFPVMSPDVTDRVFPIRSVVTVAPDAASLKRTNSTTSVTVDSLNAQASDAQLSEAAESREMPASPTYRPQSSRGGKGISSFDQLGYGRHRRTTSSRRSSASISDADAPHILKKINKDSRSVSQHSNAENPRKSMPTQEQDLGGGILSSRFKHVTTDEGHAVVTGRDGEVPQRCEDEPIHIPGAVQSFGALVALREEPEGKFSVRIVSENSKQILGYSPGALFALQSFTDILSDEQADNLIDHIDFIKDEEFDPSIDGPEVFIMTIRPPQRSTIKFWCAIHKNDRNSDLVICEFELDDDKVNPLVHTVNNFPDSPENTLDSDPTEEEYLDSTAVASKPLRVLRGARQRKGEAAAMEVFNIMSQVQEQFSSAPTLEAFLKVLCGVVKELSGFHRVMIYQFDQTWNGRVVTELLDPRATVDLYKGLHFPASDIPKQARDLYKINKVRLLYDRDQQTARLVCRTTDDLREPLDLTFSYLRAMSPIHCAYLKNMSVRASMSISINAFDELWGLIACHSYGANGMRVSFPIRKICRLVGDSAMRNIERLSYATRLQARKLIITSSSPSNPSGYIIASSDDLLSLFQADFGLLLIRDQSKILGNLEATQEALAVLEYLRIRKLSSVFSSQDITSDLPDLQYPPGFKSIAGLMYVPLSVSGGDFIIFFRKPLIREVKWAGNPYEKFVKAGTQGFLEPRQSFRAWTEKVTSKSKDWTEENIETAAVLCLVYGKFIEVWRRKEEALQSSRLTKLLLANSAHEVRTPLNAIINYLEIALEGSLDPETRENLSKSHSASKSLIYVINDLLDLTQMEEGLELVKDEVFNLPATILEATDMFQGDAKRKNLKYEVVQNPGVPHMVVGDQRRVRQATSNLIANAIQHTESGAVKIEVWSYSAQGSNVEVDIVVQDSGCGMTTDRLDALFRELEQVQTESEDIIEEFNVPGQNILSQKQITDSNESKNPKKALGLGLAVVARIVRNMNGQLRLTSEEGKGSRFTVRLPFMTADQSLSLDEPNRESTFNSDAPQTPPITEGEIVLVSGTPNKSHEISTGSQNILQKVNADRKSLGSIKTNRSKGSESRSSLRRANSQESNESAVDSLIDAISAPMLLEEPSSLKSKFIESKPSQPVTAPPSSSRPIKSIVKKHGVSRPVAGQEDIAGSKTPLKPVRVPDEEGSDVGSPISDTQSQKSIPRMKALESNADSLNMENLQVLVAEDDPINSKILKTRLERSKHTVSLTVNGEECANLYKDKPGVFDVVLMDMQMPIVDGLTSTKMIRSQECEPFFTYSQRATINGRVPIFAVSASLVERDRELYTSAGFDGWILKPIDFKRLNVLLQGIIDPECRDSCRYSPGQWQKGGWFFRREEAEIESK